MKSIFFILILMAAALSPACLQRQLITAVPPPVTLPIQSPRPYPAVLFIPETTQRMTYQSPDYIPWRARPNVDTIRPFQIAVGETFTQSARQVFPGIFKSTVVVDALPSPDAHPLIIEPRLENITLDLAYYTFDSRPPHNQMLEVGGSLEANLRLTGKGKPAWQKTYRVSIPPQMIFVNPWTGEQIAGMVAEAAAALVREMALELASETEQPPAVPLGHWLNS